MTFLSRAMQTPMLDQPRSRSRGAFVPRRGCARRSPLGREVGVATSGGVSDTFGGLQVWEALEVGPARSQKREKIFVGRQSLLGDVEYSVLADKGFFLDCSFQLRAPQALLGGLALFAVCFSQREHFSPRGALSRREH